MAEKRDSLIFRNKSTQNTPTNGDRFQIFFICDGTETKLYITSIVDTSAGIWDLYINNVLDSSGYDDYDASTSEKYRTITLTQPIKRGLNTIELRVNGKNASSSNYSVFSGGASLQ